MSIDIVSHLGTNWAFVDDVLFYEDERTGRLRRFFIFDHRIKSLHESNSSGNLRVVLETGSAYDVDVNPALGPQSGILLLLVSKG